MEKLIVLTIRKKTIIIVAVLLAAVVMMCVYCIYFEHQFITAAFKDF